MKPGFSFGFFSGTDSVTHWHPKAIYKTLHAFLFLFACRLYGVQSFPYICQNTWGSNYILGTPSTFPAKVIKQASQITSFYQFIQNKIHLVRLQTTGTLILPGLFCSISFVEIRFMINGFYSCPPKESLTIPHYKPLLAQARKFHCCTSKELSVRQIKQKLTRGNATVCMKCLYFFTVIRST